MDGDQSHDLAQESGDADGAAIGAAHGAADVRGVGNAAPSAGAAVPLSAGQGRSSGDGIGGRLNTHKGSSPGGKRARTSRTTARRGEPDSSVWFRLVDRDRRILGLLSEHKVLTTEQIAAIEFTSVRRAQDRLAQLRSLGVLFRFRESYRTGGTSQARFALGYRGARYVAAQRAEKPPTQQAHQRTLERLAWWPKLDHQLGVNGFFCELAAVARRDRDAHRDIGLGGMVAAVGTQLGQWWSEQHCTSFFRKDSYNALRPDAYGCWVERDRWVRFFLEYDTGTESLSTVVKKLDYYARFPTDEFGILAFTLHSSKREIALRQALQRASRHSEIPKLVIATSARDLHDADGPAGPVWALWQANSYRDGVTRRLRLAQLPQRGPHVDPHAGFVGQPFSELAFADNDYDLWDLINRWRPPESGWQPPHNYPVEEGGEPDDELIITDDEDGDLYPGEIA